MDFVAIKYLGLTIDICTYNYTYMCMNEVRAMGQVTIYLEDEIEKKMTAAAKTAHVSKSKWIASLIKAKVASEWRNQSLILPVPGKTCRWQKKAEQI